jgi:hypothetical protein
VRRRVLPGLWAIFARPIRRRSAYAIVVAAAVIPRLLVVAHERHNVILPPELVEKNVFFARTFVHSGTFGYVPGMPSADDQPLYGFFLIPLYWLFNGHWLSIALAQTFLSAATAVIVFEIARMLFDARWAVLAAVAATLNPYLVWHDVHVGREVLDEFVAAALVLTVLLALERKSLRLAALAGAVAGLAVLGNVRLALVPAVLVVLVVFLWRSRRQGLVAALALVLASVVVVLPWMVRNRVQVGCFTLTTNAQALWKANNINTDRVLAEGKWIDDVPLVLPPQGIVFGSKGQTRFSDECAAMRFYQHRVIEFWKKHPGEKARIAARGTALLWDPRAQIFDERGSKGTVLRPVSRLENLGRIWAEGLYMSVLYSLGLIGIFRVGRRFFALSLSLLAYQTLAAAAFVGVTRYRAPWDFLLVLLATAGLTAVLSAATKRASAEDSRRPAAAATTSR